MKFNTTEEVDTKAYFAKKIQIDEIRSNETLLKWKVLSEANKLGRKIWGKEFSVRRLSEDMGLPLTTTQRCLSLDRASDKSWELVKEKKISAFKLAMVCLTKNKEFHDETVQVVIEQGLSTSEIKKFRPRNIEDVKVWKHEKAIKDGYAHEETARRALKSWLSRGKLFLLMPISSIGASFKEEYMDELKLLHLKLGRYIDNDGKSLQQV